MAQKARVTVLRSGRSGFWMSSEKYSSKSIPFFQEDAARDVIKFVLTYDTELFRVLRDIALHYAYSKEFTKAFNSDYYDSYWSIFGNVYENFEDEFPEIELLTEATDLTLMSEFMTIQFLKGNNWVLADVKLLKTSANDNYDKAFYSELCDEFIELWSICGTSSCDISSEDKI